MGPQNNQDARYGKGSPMFMFSSPRQNNFRNK